MEELEITLQDIITYQLANTTGAELIVNIYALDHVSEEFLLFDIVTVPPLDTVTVRFTADGVYSFGYADDTKYYIAHVYKILRDCMDNYIRDIVCNCDKCEQVPLNQLMRVWITAETYWNMLEALPHFDHVHPALPDTELYRYVTMARIIEETYRYCVQCSIIDMTEVHIPEDATPEEIEQLQALRFRIIYNSARNNCSDKDPCPSEKDIIFVPSFRILQHCGCS